jgi:putative inorganic carbon (hco3(-)) transporter
VRLEPRAVAVGLLASGAAVIAGYVSVALAYNVDDRAAATFLLALVLVPAVVVGVLRRPVVGVAVVFLVFPQGSVPIDIQVPKLGTFSAPVVMVTVFCISMLIMLRRLALGQAPLAWHPALWWALALLGWCVVSLTSAQNDTLAVKQIVALAGAILFACVVYTAVESMADVRWVIGSFLAVMTYVAISATSSGASFSDQFGGEVVTGRLTGAFSHPNQLGLYAAIAVCLGIGLAFGARTGRGRVIAILVSALALAPLLLSLSRGAWIGCGLAFLYFLVALREARRALVIAGVPFVIVGALVGSFAPSTPEVQVIGARARALTAISPYDERPQIYAEAQRQIRSSPLLGQGPGNFPYASSRALYADATVSNDHAHNLWLTWAAEAGIPAAALIVALMISVGRVARRTGQAAARRSRRDRAVIAGIVAALITVVGQGIFDYLLRNAVLLVTVWALVALLLASARIYQDDDARRVASA